MFPKISFTSETENEIKPIDGEMHHFDFEKGCYSLADGNLIPIKDPRDKIKQWLKFLIKAELDHVAIYKSTGFGLSLKKYIGKKFIPLGLIASEVKEQLNNKIKLNELIKEVSKVQVTKNSKGQLMFDIWVITNNQEEIEVNEIV